MSLSAKFATLSGPAAGGKKKGAGIVLKKVVAGTPRKGQSPVTGKKKINQAISAQKQKRQSQVQLKRGIAGTASPGNKAASGKSPKGKGPKGKGPKGKGPKGKGPKGEKKKPVTAEDLDNDIDTYWYKAGKGPNPELVKLDADLEAYRASKTTTTETA